MAASQCLTTPLTRRSFNGDLRTAHFLPTRAYLCSKLPFSRSGGFTFAPRVSLLKISSAPPLPAEWRCSLRSRGALRTSACLHAATSKRAGSSGDILASLAIAVAIPVVSGMLASLFNTANVDWYNKLRKPDWNPPAWLFGAAWGVLYAVMGFASWLVWARGGWDVHGYALSLYVLQLLLNLAWPAIFFGAKHMALALVDILSLWVSLFACIRAFQVINPLAARLLYPYLAWVTFASALTYKYWELNSV